MWSMERESMFCLSMIQWKDSQGNILIRVINYCNAIFGSVYFNARFVVGILTRLLQILLMNELTLSCVFIVYKRNDQFVKRNIWEKGVNKNFFNIFCLQIKFCFQYKCVLLWMKGSFYFIMLLMCFIVWFESICQWFRDKNNDFVSEICLKCTWNPTS